MPGLTREQKQRQEQIRIRNAEQVETFKTDILRWFEIEKKQNEGWTIQEHLDNNRQGVKAEQESIRKSIDQLEETQANLWKKYFELERKREAIDKLKSENE
jgi:hypothetical protein